MRPRITLSTLRKIARQEETMLRAVMPRISEADPTPLAFVADGPRRPKATRTFTLTYTLAEVQHA